MTSKSKAKGSAYERQVAEQLSTIYEAKFLRNISGSGAYVGGKNAARKASLTEDVIRHTKGDVIPPAEYKLMNIECKSYADFSFHLLWSSEYPLLDGWLDQLLTAGDASDVNILFFKITRRGQWVAVQTNLTWDTECSHMRYNSSKHGDWLIYSNETFFKLNRDHLKTYSTQTINTTQRPSQEIKG